MKNDSNTLTMPELIQTGMRLYPNAEMENRMDVGCDYFTFEVNGCRSPLQSITRTLMEPTLIGDSM